MNWSNSDVSMFPKSLLGAMSLSLAKKYRNSPQHWWSLEAWAKVKGFLCSGKLVSCSCSMRSRSKFTSDRLEQATFSGGRVQVERPNTYPNTHWISNAKAAATTCYHLVARNCITGELLNWHEHRQKLNKVGLYIIWKGVCSTQNVTYNCNLWLLKVSTQTCLIFRLKMNNIIMLYYTINLYNIVFSYCIIIISYLNELSYCIKSIIKSLLY